MLMHPLTPISGEEVFDVPLSVRTACKAALTATKVGDAHPYAFAIAQHLAVGEPVGESTVKRLHEVLSETDGLPGDRSAKARALMGGATVLKWVSGLVAKPAPAQSDEFERRVNVLKVDDALGVVFGWAMVCKEDGEDYFDTQGDHIPEAAMLKAATDFMLNSRVLGDMHKQAEGGSVLFAFPLTSEVAKSFGIECKTSGLMIGVKPASQATLEKFRTGEYTGFSIGGRRITDEDA
jgi:hypothetical protein